MNWVQNRRLLSEGKKKVRLLTRGVFGCLVLHKTGINSLVGSYKIFAGNDLIVLYKLMNWDEVGIFTEQHSKVR